VKLEFLCDSYKIKEIARLRKIDLKEINDTILLKKAEENKKSIKIEWQEHEKKLMSLINMILPNLDDDFVIKIYIFPNEVPVGACNCQTKEILFGYKNEYDGFHLVTICHEITHILIYKYRKEKLISRVTDETIAFLVAECEIRKQLTGKEYFTKFFDGNLSELHNKAVYTARSNLDIWNEYIKEKEKNVEKLLFEIEKNVSIEEKEKYNSAKLKDFLN
jgi:hypothetical protein